MPVIHRYVLSKLHNPKDATHAPSARVQAAFLYAWRSRAAFRFEQGSFVA
ncbi:RNA polymerase sigma factor [Streptomyces coelicoflavus]